MTEDYHEWTDPKVHENWLRHGCMELAIQRAPTKSVAKLIEDAREIEKYVAAQTPAPVLRISTKAEGQKR